MKNFLQNTVLLLLSTSISLLVVEASFRIYKMATEARGLEALNSSINTPVSGQVVKLGGMIQLSGNEKIVYEFIPEISVTHKNVPVKINSEGFRGPLIAAEKPEDSKRIVGIGDSVMYGWGVNENEAYLSSVEVLLNQYECNSKWEVVNTAVPGYNTAIEVEVLREKGVKYEPDYVVVGFVENDFSMPRFIRTPTDYYALDRSFVFEQLGLLRSSAENMTETKSEFVGGSIGNIDIAKVPPKYHYMVGIDGVIRSFNELKILSEAHNFEVIILALRWFPNEVRQAAIDHGFHLLNASMLWKKYLRSANDNSSRSFTLSNSDPHPSAEAHSVIATGLAETIRDISSHSSSLQQTSPGQQPQDHCSN